MKEKGLNMTPENMALLDAIEERLDKRLKETEKRLDDRITSNFDFLNRKIDRNTRMLECKIDRNYDYLDGFCLDNDRLRGKLAERVTTIENVLVKKGVMDQELLAQA